nr:class D sortase [Tissierella sp.]
MRGKISLLFILIGMLIMAYPKSIELYRDYQQDQLLNEWEDALKDVEIDEDYQELSKEEYESYQEELIPEILAMRSDIVEESVVAENEKPNKAIDQDKNTKGQTKKISKNFEGIIEIEKIDLKLPILTGASQNNLKSAIGSIKNTGEMGRVGNYSLAGHRNLTRGRNFNRLDEVVKGDIIEVNNGKERFKYRVTQKLYVKPNETNVLKSDGDSREITLVTCHPLGSSEQRLIIKGKIE